METSTAKAAGRVVDPDVLQIDPRWLQVRLASPWQRACGMLVDLVLVALLSLLANPILGLFTGLTFASLGSRHVSPARFWQVFRWVLIAAGGGVMILSGFLLVGRPLVRTSAFNLGRVERAPALEPVMLSPSAGNAELRRAVTEYERQVGTLRDENERLRESARGNSLVNVAVDLTRTLGLTFGWAGVYFTLSTAWFGGRTPGKWLVGTRVVRLDGRRLTAMDAFTRNGGYAAGLATGLIGFLRLLWEPNRQAIEDKIAGTVVIAARGPVPPPAVASSEP